MSDRPTVTTLGAGARYDTATLNTNFTNLRNAFDTVLGINGVSGSNNTLTANLDVGGFNLLDVGSIACDSITVAGSSISASVAAAAASAAAAATAETNAETAETNAQTAETNATASAAAAAASAASVNLPAIVATEYYRGNAAGTAIETRSPSEVRTDLGLVIGTNVQAYDATIVVDADIGVSVQAYDADTLKADTADVLTAGFATTPYNAGTKSSGTFTPDEANGNFQYAVNGGAHTLAPPTNNCQIVVQYTNNSSAGSITTSGFTLVRGDSLDTTDGNDFLLCLTKINGFSLLDVVALQ